MSYPNPELVNFVRKTKERGFEDWQIRTSLIKHGWDSKEVDSAFSILRHKKKPKSKVVIYLDREIIKLIEKRARKNILTLPEQIEDILRRSCLSMKKPGLPKENLDDAFIGIFSRRRRRKG